MPSQHKKTFVYSNGQTQKICEGILKDHAEAEKYTESVLIETAILGTFLPKNKYAASLVKQLYSENIPLADAYKQICRAFSAPTNIDAFLNANAKPLLAAIADHFSADPYFPSGNHKSLQYIQQDLLQLRSLIQDPQDHKLCEVYTHLLKDAPAEIGPLFIVNFLTRNWTSVRFRYEAYDILVHLIEVSPDAFQDTAQNRYKFIKAAKALYGE